jgi:hypothetical protein
MFARIVHYHGIACSKCRRDIVPFDRQTVSQVVTLDGHLYQFEPSQFPRGAAIFVQCECGNEEPVPVDGRKASVVPLEHPEHIVDHAYILANA